MRVDIGYELGGDPCGIILRAHPDRADARTADDASRCGAIGQSVRARTIGQHVDRNDNDGLDRIIAIELRQRRLQTHGRHVLPIVRVQHRISPTGRRGAVVARRQVDRELDLLRREVLRGELQSHH
jgi:hypothetical protein